MQEEGEFDFLYEEDDEYKQWLAEYDNADCEDDEEERMSDESCGSERQDCLLQLPDNADTQQDRHFAWSALNPVPLHTYISNASRRQPTPGTAADHTSPLYPFSASLITGLPKVTTLFLREQALSLELVRLLQGLPSGYLVLSTEGGDSLLGSFSEGFLSRETESGIALMQELAKLRSFQVKYKGDVEVGGMTAATLRACTQDLLAAATAILRTQYAVALLRRSCPTPYALREGAANATNGVAPLCPPLTQVIKNTLQCCFRYFSLVEEKMRSDPNLCNILVLNRVLRESNVKVWLRQCEYTVKAALELTKDKYGATVLLSKLYKTTEQRRSENCSASPLAFTIFSVCLRPYLTEIGRWISTGRLLSGITQEPMLFISESARRGGDPYAEWDTKWAVNREKLPCFISPDIANVVLYTGKSVRFLASLRSKLIVSSIKASAQFRAGAEQSDNNAKKLTSAAETCHTPSIDFYSEFQRRLLVSVAREGSFLKNTLQLNGSIPSILQFTPSELVSIHLGMEQHQHETHEALQQPPLCISLQDAVNDVVETYSRSVGDALVTNLHTHCDMKARLDLIESVFLLRRGNVMQYFCTTFLFPLARKGDWQGKPPAEVMHSHFVGSWLVNKASEVDQRNAAKVHCRWEPDEANVACLRFNPNDPTPRLPLDRPSPPTSLRIISSFALDVFTHGTYSALNVVFPADVTQCYTRVSQVLLTIAYAQHILVSMKLPKLSRKPNALEKSIVATKLHLLHFMQALSDHLLQKVCAFSPP